MATKSVVFAVIIDGLANSPAAGLTQRPC